MNPSTFVLPTRPLVRAPRLPRSPLRLLSQLGLWLLVSGLLVAIVAALAPLQQLFASFGTALPTATQWLLDWPWLVVALLLSGWIVHSSLLLIHLLGHGQRSHRAAIAAALGNLLLQLLAVTALYLPLWQIAQPIG